SSSSSSSLSLSDKETLAALANYAAVVIENARLVMQLQQWNNQLEQRVAERTHELNVVNAQLTQLDEMKTEFIYNVSHELRNPITNLKLQSDLLRNHIDSPRRDRYVAAIAKQVDIMAQLIGDMLDLLQLEKMPAQVTLSMVDLNGIVRDVALKYSEHLHGRPVRLGLDLADHPLTVAGEPVQLRRAVGHLMRNAINYTTGGTICIRTFLAGSRIYLQVQDTGIGIAEADLPHICQRFFRGTNVSQSTIPGAGLGLSLVREVAKLHQGELAVESKLNQGSTFCLWFPAPKPVADRTAVAR
ncbi:MAG TPA: HAMP domain-containing sensor histidine kinase, partial [Caldilineaceae bacterium]|nr:HAMP domain-containing sensor histidine kinase [Caldilineaceae bacterium]